MGGLLYLKVVIEKCATRRGKRTVGEWTSPMASGQAWARKKWLAWVVTDGR